MSDVALGAAIPDPIDDRPTARVVPFETRAAAGCLLAQALSHHAGTDAFVFGIAPGGLAVAKSVASALRLEMDAWIVHTLRSERDPRIVVGAIAEGGTLIVNQDARALAGVAVEQLRELAHQGSEVTLAIRRRYADVRSPLDVRGKTTILVDEGAVAGGTMIAAIDGLRRRGAAKIVAALPVATPAAIAAVRGVSDDVVCLATPPRLRRIGSWYLDFRQLSDGAIIELLASQLPRGGMFQIA